ncbi:MAG: hypothetical protein LBL17_03435 [Coxiellaceae bacterium]|jgi:lipoic acid synthetase|nr:hypothetical protein [Coxiellaceae bacterium]
MEQKNRIEILTPDFRHSMIFSLTTLGIEPPDVFNHNIETVPRLYPLVRPAADYQSSLNLLKTHKELYLRIPTKSGLMLGLGETYDEIYAILNDLRTNNVDKITIGQYLQPSKDHLKVQRFVTPLEFSKFAKLA